MWGEIRLDKRMIQIGFLALVLAMSGCAAQESGSEELSSASQLTGFDGEDVFSNVRQAETARAKIETLKQLAMHYYWNNEELEKAEELFAGHEFRGKYDVIEHAFLEAYSIDPTDLDLLYSAASAQAAKGEYQNAKTSFKGIVAQDPAHFEAHLKVALYADLTGNLEVYETHMSHLEEIDWQRAAEYREKLGRAQEWMGVELKTEVDSDVVAEDHAFVVLGFLLTEDGEMQDTLVRRLELALDAANEYPHTKIMVSGGVSRNGVTEADLMFDWLRANGVAEDRLIKEGAASNTVENALYSIAIANLQEIQGITLVSSPGHMRRALTVFEEANRKLDVLADRQISNLVYMDDQDERDEYIVTDREKASIYRDLIRTSGIWSYPGITR